MSMTFTCRRCGARLAPSLAVYVPLRGYHCATCVTRHDQPVSGDPGDENDYTNKTAEAS